MASIASFTLNPFAENTYIIYDETKECIIIDPGCQNPSEEHEINAFIQKLDLVPVKLINTHCHIDHVFGNKFICETYNLKPYYHEAEIPIYAALPEVCAMYGFPEYKALKAEAYIIPGEPISFGNTSMDVFFTPGHSPGSVSFYLKKEKSLIAGDVLFKGSIGRTDLPGGDTETLMKSIFEKVLILPDDTKVYSGHGPSTTVGEEKLSNPFVLEYGKYANPK